MNATLRKFLAPLAAAPSTLSPAFRPSGFKSQASGLLYALAVLCAMPSARADNGADTWVGNTSADLSGANWTGTNNPPISPNTSVTLSSSANVTTGSGTFSF